jgi:hypothetical protein
MAKTSQQSGVTGWLAILVILGLSGWTAFTLYRQYTMPKVTAEAPIPVKNARLETFIDQGRQLLDKGDLHAAEEQFQKASGLSESDPRVQEGLAMVALLDAEQTWWQWTFGKHAQDRRDKLLRQLGGQIDRARALVSATMAKTEDEALRGRLKLAEDRLNSMLVVALALHGDLDEAKGALSTRLADHPQATLLGDFISTIDSASQPEPTEDEADAGAASAAPIAAAKPPHGGSGPEPKGKHYEFHDEPKTHGLPPTPGELQIPVGKERVETVVLPTPTP